MHSAGVLAGGKKARHRRGAVGREHDAAHHVMRGWDHLDAAAGKVKAAVGAALDHALEIAPHVGGAEMAHLDVDAAVRAGEARADAILDRAADDVARRALTARIVLEHEALA